MMRCPVDGAFCNLVFLVPLDQKNSPVHFRFFPFFEFQPPRRGEIDRFLLPWIISLGDDRVRPSQLADYNSPKILGGFC